MTLNDHFKLDFHYYEQPLRIYFTYLQYCRAWLYQVIGGDVRKRTVIRRIFGSAERLRIFRRLYNVRILTNKVDVRFSIT